MDSIKYIVLLAALLTTFGGCDKKDIKGNEGERTINVLSPPNSTSVPYRSITLAIDAKNTGTVSVINTTFESTATYRGIRSADRFLVHSIELIEGENRLVISTMNGEGEQNTQELTVTSTGQNIPLQFSMSRSQGYGELATVFNVKSRAAPVESYSFDFGGDGVLDTTSSDSATEFLYTKAGQFFPSVMVETGDGLLFTSQSDTAILVRAKPPVGDVSALSGISVVDFHIVNDETLFVLSSDQRVFKINTIGTEIEAEINLAGISDPSGLCMDRTENIYVTDKGSDLVFKYLKTSSYQPDPLISVEGSFGGTGTGDGELDEPSDCMVDSSKDREKIFVVDKGNNRIQIFNRAGVYLSQFNGENSDAGALLNPEGILGTSVVPVISDTGNNMIRVFQQNGAERRNFGGGMLKAPHKITESQHGLVVADAGNERVLFMTHFGDIVDELTAQGRPSVAASARDKKDMYFVALDGRLGATQYTSGLDTPDASPEKVVEKFVAAIVANDRLTLSSLAVSERVVERIYFDEDKRSEIIKQLGHITVYKLEARDNVFAGVSLQFDNTEETFPVTLIRAGNTWLIKRF